MPLVGRQDGRNFGYGRQLSYAGPQALRHLFGGGHYGTVKAHSDRWQAFVRWCRSEDGPGFNDARQIDRQTLLDYAVHLRHQLNKVASPLPPRRTDCPASTGPWPRFAVISM